MFIGYGVLGIAVGVAAAGLGMAKDYIDHRNMENYIDECIDEKFEAMYGNSDADYGTGYETENDLSDFEE